jgi:hypothetical protein
MAVRIAGRWRLANRSTFDVRRPARRHPAHQVRVPTWPRNRARSHAQSRLRCETRLSLPGRHLTVATKSLVRSMRDFAAGIERRIEQHPLVSTTGGARTPVLVSAQRRRFSCCAKMTCSSTSDRRAAREGAAGQVRHWRPEAASFDWNASIPRQATRLAILEADRVTLRQWFSVRGHLMRFFEERGYALSSLARTVSF